jgi:hypothetical protein
MSSKTLPLLAALFLLPALAGAAPPLPKGAEIRVSVLENVAHNDPQVAVFPDGGFVVVWGVGPPDGVGRYVIHARFFDRNGTPTTGEFRLVDRVGGSQFVDQVAADGNGSFLVAWTEEEAPRGKANIIVRRFDRAGQPLGARIQANAPHRRSRLYDSVLAVGPDGRFAVAWTANVNLNSHAHSMARIFSAKGKPLSAQFILREGSSGIDTNQIFSRPVAVGLKADGNLVAQVQDDVGPFSIKTYLGFYDFRGNTLSERALTDVHFIETRGADFAMAVDGSMIATWSEWDLVAQRFAPDGTPRGEKFKVGQQKGVESGQIRPQIAMVAGGTFVIVWHEWERDGDEGGVFGRVFSANGRPLSGDLQISTTSAGDQYRLSIAAARQGAVVAVWRQLDSEGQSGVFARLLSSDR